MVAAVIVTSLVDGQPGLARLAKPLCDGRRVDARRDPDSCRSLFFATAIITVLSGTAIE
jgi:uncharacterized protein